MCPRHISTGNIAGMKFDARAMTMQKYDVVYDGDKTYM